MATPTPVAYNAVSGARIVRGRAAAAALPAWAAASPLNAWMEIPGTSGAGGTMAEAYSGWAKLPNGKIGIALAGGHSDGNKNSVAVIDLLANAPAWVEVCPESPTHVNEVAYEADGKPTSCHTYQTLAWVPAKNRLMRFGVVGVPTGGNTNFPNVDGFNLDTNTWDPAGTHPGLAAQGAGFSSGTCFNPVTGKELLIFGGQYFDPASGVKTAISTGSVTMPRNPWVWDSTRQHMFGMCYADNQRFGAASVIAAKIVGTTATQITLTGSDALTLLLAEQPEYAGMDYDSVNNCYLWYCGKTDKAAAAGRVYKITPNATDTWTIEVFAYGGSGITPVATINAGLNNRFAYIPELKGVVLLATKAANLYFLRTA